MTPEKTIQAFDTIALILTDCFDTGTKCSPEETFNEVRLSPEDAAKHVDNINLLQTLEHLYFMTQEGKRLVADGRIEKAMRWLGFLQGALWGLGITTIEEQKNINRPDEVPYDGKRI